MVALSIAVGTSAAVSLLAYLAWRSFYDGDAGDDVIVRAHRISGPTGSVSVGVAIANPGHAPAWLPWRSAARGGRGGPVPRRAAKPFSGHPACRLPIARSEHSPRGKAKFVLSARRTRHPLQLEVTVASCRRLRRHHLDVAALATSLDLPGAMDARYLARRHLSGEVLP